MFYSQVVLARKGPLGKIWLAAHYDKKLNKQQIYTTDIEDSCKCVTEPSNSMALRVAGHLMLGIVRIYSRKVRYLMDDCKDAMWKMKLAFRTASVDLPESQTYGTGIDDLRFFGAVANDQDFPDLENMAFNIAPSTPLHLLLSNGEGEDMEDMWERRSTPSTPRISDVEFARGDQRDEFQQQNFSFKDRSSFGSGVNQSNSISKMADISRISMGMGIGGMDEEIPAFGEDDDLMMGNMDDHNIPSYDNDNFYNASAHDEGTGLVLESLEGGEEEKVINDNNAEIIDAVTTRASSRHNKTSSNEAPLEGILKTSNKSKKRARKKARVVIVDQQVELNNKRIRELMSDRSELLRRNPDEPLPSRSSSRLSRNIYSNRLSYGSHIDNSSVGGLAPELEDLLKSSTQSRASAQKDYYQSEYDDMYPDPEMARGDGSRDMDNNSFIQGDARRRGSGGNYNENNYDDIGGSDYAYEPTYEHNSFSDVNLSKQNALSTSNDHEYYEEENYLGGDNNYNSSSSSSNNNNILVEDERPRIAAPIEVNSTDWNPRTKHVFDIIDDQLQRNKSITFQDLSAGVSKRTAATCFLELLQLKTWDVIDAKQAAPFQNIIITAVQ